MKKEKNIPLKNYITLAVIILVTIILCVYFYMWHLAYEDSKLNNPMMNKYLQVINYNELDNYISENKNAYVYVSVLENEKIRNFELSFKNMIKEYSLKNDMLYLNLTEVYNNQKQLNEAKAKYNINDNYISDVPCIVVFKNGEIEDIYNIKSHNYNLDLIKVYLTTKGLIK